MDHPKKLNKQQLKDLFERARYYAVDIKQRFWELGYHIKALEAEIKALQNERDALRQTNLKLETKIVSEPIAQEPEAPKEEARPTTPKSGEHLAGMFQPSGVTREQIAYTLWRKRNATANDNKAYEGFRAIHRLSDGMMKELHDKWEESQKFGSSRFP